MIAILRDPVSRCVSHYGMDALRGVADRGGFDTTIHDLLSSAALRSSRRLEAPAYIAWGEYGRILKAYYDVFPREQIYVCFTSDLEHAPGEFMQRLFEHLDVDRSFAPARLRRRYRQGAASPWIARLPSPAALERSWPASVGRGRYGGRFRQGSRHARSYAPAEQATVSALEQAGRWVQSSRREP